MTADLPAWIPADPGTSPALPKAEGRGGRVIVLLSTEGALSGGWAGEVTVDLAASWSQGGARIVVADAGLSTPLLHEALGIPNHEGLVDALRWGASVQRVVRRTEGRTFLALTAGTAVADTAAVLALPRWHALCSGFREAGVTLAILVPSWEESLSAVLDEADGIVVLSEPGEDFGDLIKDVEAPVFAVTGRAATEELPPEDTSFGPVPVESSAETSASDEPVAPPSEDLVAQGHEEDEDLSGWGTPARDGAPAFVHTDAEDQGDSWLEEPSAAPTPGDTFGEEVADEDTFPVEPTPAVTAADVPTPRLADDDFVLPDPIPVPPSLEEIVEESEAPVRRGRSRSWLLLLLLAAVVVAAGVAAWLGYLEIPGLTPRGGTASSTPAPEPAPTAVAPTPATETSPVQSYSLALGAYRDGAVAAQRVSGLGTQVPGVYFQSVPVLVEGTLFHRVLAGPAVDSAAVAALSSRIAETASLDPSPWVARRTPLAFVLGEVPDREAADLRVAELDGLGVAAYVLAVDYSDGTTRYRVFAGAFADETEASYLSGLLDERGLSSATLSDRIGRLPE